MIKLLNPSQIAHITSLAIDTSTIMDYLCSLVIEESVQTGLQLEQVAQESIEEHNATPAFANERNNNGEEFGYALCVSVNDNVVHCRPNDTQFQYGDLVSIDFGMKRDGVYSDMCRTVVYGESTPHDLIIGTELILSSAAHMCTPGRPISEISALIERSAMEADRGLVIDYTGHGIGTSLHQPPIIPNAPIPGQKDYVLRPGMVICLEPMLTTGRGECVVGSDGWTVSTADGSKAAHCEDMILVTKKGPKVLTR